MILHPLIHLKVGLGVLTTPITVAQTAVEVAATIIISMGEVAVMFCQVCNKPGHTAVQCYCRYDSSFQGDTTPPAAFLTALSVCQLDNAWYPDSGATHHLTADMANLSSLSKYHGQDQVHVGNGNTLSIKHVGSSLLRTRHNSFKLTNMLHVPHIYYQKSVLCQKIY